LKHELRDHIRFLADYEIMNTDWMRMAESLHQIANVAFMETHLPPSEENPLNQQGKKEQGTLWDQERDELAIRILLEEGKLNLAMRILHKFKQLQRSPKFDETFKTTCRKFSTEASTVTERCRVFEQSVGTLLRLALQHVEALQIMDLPQLVAHCKELLTEAVKSERKEPNTSDQDKLQDTVVVQYLASIASHLENIGDEDKVMDELDQQGIIPLFVDQMHKHYNWYKVDTLIAASKFLSHCMGSEAYITEPARFLNAACQKKCVDLKGMFVSELISTYGLQRREVQQLMDHLERWERVHGQAVHIPLRIPAPSKTDKRDDDKKNSGDGKKTEASTASSTTASGVSGSSSTAPTKTGAKSTLASAVKQRN